MDRWTMKELAETDDITFAICILNERRRGLTAYSPLGLKIKEAERTLSQIKDETEKYRAAISEVCMSENKCDDGEETDLSDCDEETKAEILDNDSYWKTVFQEAEEKDNCENETYNCDTCVKNGDCIEQGIDGSPRWQEEKEGGEENEND